MTIIFLPVKDTSSKLAKLSNVAQKHLEKKEPLLFLVPDQPALEFLDKLLWTTPSESFLPHPTPLLQISLELQSPFSAIFNLKPAPLLEGSLLKGSAEIHNGPAGHVNFQGTVERPVPAHFAALGEHLHHIVVRVVLVVEQHHLACVLRLGKRAAFGLPARPRFAAAARRHLLSK